MNKKVWVGAAVVFVLAVVMDYVIHNILLASAYMDTAHLWRPEEEMKMGVMIITTAVAAFFLALIFSKGYEGKGIAEGVRYGLYTGMLINTPFAYGTYAVMPIPYSLALQWFLYGMVEFIVFGIALAVLFGMKPKAATSS